MAPSSRPFLSCSSSLLESRSLASAACPALPLSRGPSAHMHTLCTHLSDAFPRYPSRCGFLVEKKNSRRTMTRRQVGVQGERRGWNERTGSRDGVEGCGVVLCAAVGRPLEEVGDSELSSRGLGRHRFLLTATTTTTTTALSGFHCIRSSRVLRRVYASSDLETNDPVASTPLQSRSKPV